MKLESYMRLKKLTDAQLGAEIGKDRTTVLRYRQGAVIPSLEVAASIERITDGAVTFRDFVPVKGDP